MTDKLLVEIDLLNGEIADAIPGLVFLAHELDEAGLMVISDHPEWSHRTGKTYDARWRFTEGEMTEYQIALDIDFLYQLNAALDAAMTRDPELKLKLGQLQKRLESHLDDAYSPMFGRDAA